MADKDKLRINIKIEGRSYPLTIDRKDEENHRLAAKLIKETVAKYKGLFRVKDAQDILAMAAFEIALAKTELHGQKDKTLFIDEIKNMNDDISDFLKEKGRK